MTHKERKEPDPFFNLQALVRNISHTKHTYKSYILTLEFNNQPSNKPNDQIVCSVVRARYLTMWSHTSKGRVLVQAIQTIWILAFIGIQESYLHLVETWMKRWCIMEFRRFVSGPQWSGSGWCPSELIVQNIFVVPKKMSVVLHRTTLLYVLSTAKHTKTA